MIDNICRVINTLSIIFVVFLICLGISRCSTEEVKPYPEYRGVDPKVVPNVNEYKNLAKIQHITFKNKVTIGFKKIKMDEVIGLTSYGDDWREIDLDVDYWNKASRITRMILLYHELTHAYCSRGHTYGKNNTAYPEADKLPIWGSMDWFKNGNPNPGETNPKDTNSDEPKPGRYDDLCPISVMYPRILPDGCTMAHYDDYIREMFLNCDPW